MSKFGVCRTCGSELTAIWFTEEETKIIGCSPHKTGRTRKACSHLQCEYCGDKECVDDTFDSAWR